MSTDPKDRWHELGSFIREQRGTARLSLRRLSELAGISNPYLSQIERGLRRPSAEILQQIAKALRISAET
ncbi:MAG: helix-turn-helix transcriptional regulator, partial [Acidimicrobiales bacterium]